MLPSVLKDMILYNDAQAYIGKAKTVTLPNLSRKMEAWRGAGMHRAVKIDMGAEDDLAIEHSYGGPERQIFEQYGLLGVSAVGLRFVGAYQNDETGAYDTYEIVTRGRHSEIAMGDANIAATGIKNMLLALTSGDAATKRQGKAYQALGLDAVKMSKQMQRDAGGAILTVLERIQALPAAAQASTLSQLFGTQSVTAIAPLLNNLDELKRNFALVGNESQYAGSMLEEYTNAIDNSEGSVQLAINSQKALAGIMGDTLLPMVQDVADRVREAGKGMFEWAEQHPNLTKAIMMFMGVGGGLLILLGALALAFAAVTFAAAPLVKILGVSIGAFFGWAAAIIAAIALVATAAYLIYENWDAIVQWWNELWDSIGEAAAAALDLLIDGFMNFTPLGLFIQAMMPVLDYLRGLDLFEIGQQIIAGLIRGVTDKLKALKDTVIGAASSVSNWFKEKLGIHSPSRVFAQFGGFMMQGLEGGIAADQAGPLDRIRMISADIMKAMAAGAAVPAIAASPAAAAASPSSASIGPVTIVIQQQPGQNAQDLAQLIRREIEAIKRGEAAAARSRFADEQDYGGFA